MLYMSYYKVVLQREELKSQSLPVSRHPPIGKMWQPATSGFLLPASFALLAFHFLLFTSGFSLKLFVLCLERRAASIPAKDIKEETEIKLKKSNMARNVLHCN